MLLSVGGFCSNRIWKINFLYGRVRLHLRVHHETWWHYKSKERLCEVCVLRHRGQQWQFPYLGGLSWVWKEAILTYLKVVILLQCADGSVWRKLREQQTNRPGFNQALPEHVHKSRYFPFRTHTHKSYPNKYLLPPVIPSQFTNRKNSSMVDKILFQSELAIGLKGKRSWPALKYYSKIRLTFIHSADCITTVP